MKKQFKGTFYDYAKLVVGFVIGSFLFVSCNEDPLETHEPAWLGASIYEYLKTDGHFTNYVKLIDDLDYTEVLSKTGSKTVFVANDSAFNEFFKKNDWGVSSYEALTLSQKKLILNFGMINNAYLVGMLSNYNNGGLVEGGGMRIKTAVSFQDSLPFVNGSSLPVNPYWASYRTKGMYLLSDFTPLTMMYFTQKHLEQARITDADFKFITGVDRVENDAHVFNDKVVKRDITCKNGYLNILQTLLIAPPNMSQYITQNPNLSKFSKLLDRFCAPFYSPSITLEYKITHPEFSDSIFTKIFFAKRGGSLTYPSGTLINTDLLLPFDPAWNSYNMENAALESDMGAMLVPNNEAMENYLNSDLGAVIKERFKLWDSVPIEILPLFIKRHMRNSFIQSVPSRFSTMVDEDNSILPVSQSDVEKVTIGTNGVVYETNKVYPPDDYSSVYGPVILSANDAAPTNKTKVWKWAITLNDFRLYLNSLVSKYSFFVPTDEYFKNYIDPISYGKDVQGVLKYWYNDKSSMVNATVYKYDKLTNVVGDSVGVIAPSVFNDSKYYFLKNRLLDILNMHIVVGGVETGKSYYLTKGNVALKIEGSGTDMTIAGGENLALNDPAKVTKMYNQTNGKTYFIDKPIQAPLSSVYKILSEKPEFNSFYKLLVGFPVTSSSVIFVSKKNYYGLDFNIKFFNTFNYTVYVPTNSAIEDAIARGVIKPWDSQGDIVGINDLVDDSPEQKAAILNLERFIRYHFQDNSVFIDGGSVNSNYQSATMKTDNLPSIFGTFKNKYYKIGVSGDGSNLTLQAENSQIAHVITSPGLYNIMTRDLIFNDKPSVYKNIDGTGIGIDFSSSMITTSSTAVIHQIDSVLGFQQ